MPNWKKIITSGSDAQLNSLELNNGVTGSFTGSFIGDGSQLTGITATSSPGGSDSQIQYNNGGTTSGAANFVYDDVNQRVGIGTTSPDGKLEVIGDTRILGDGSDTTAGQVSIEDGGGFRKLILKSSRSGINHSSINTQTGELRLGTEGSDDITIDNGNVGIGTTNIISNVKTQINKNSNSNYSTTTSVGSTSCNIVLRDLSDTSIYQNPFTSLQFISGDSGAGVASIVSGRESAGSSFFAFHTGNASTASEKMRIDSSGNVGIGTTSPDSKLSIGEHSPTAASDYRGEILLGKVKGTLNTTSGIEIQGSNFSNGYGYRILSADLGSGQVPLIFQRRKNSTSWTEAMRLDIDGNLGIGTTSLSEKLEVDGNIKIGANQKYIAGELNIRHNGNGIAVISENTTGGGQIYFRPQGDNSSTNQMRLYENGNLEVNGNIRANRFTDRNNTSFYVDPGSSGTSINIAGQIEMQEQHFINRRFSLSNVDTLSTAYIILCRNTGGNDVNGYITMDRTSGLRHASRATIIVSAGSSLPPVGTVISQSTSGVGKPTYKLVTLTYNGDTYIALRIDNPDDYYESSGAYFTGRIVNTGANTLTPVQASNVSNISTFSINASHQIDGNEIWHEGNLRGDGDNDNRYVRLSTNQTISGEKYFTDNVGIGTTSPNEKLHISEEDEYFASDNGVYRWGNDRTIGVRIGTGNVPEIDFRRWTGSSLIHAVAKISIERPSNNNEYGLNFKIDRPTSNTEATTSLMFIERGGDVGIGTTSPNDKLEVNGNIRANRFTDRNNTAYYVDPGSSGTSIKLNGIIDTKSIKFTNSTSIADANNFLNFIAQTNSIFVGSHSTGSTNYPTEFGHFIMTKGATNNRSMALWKANGNNSSFYLGNYNNSQNDWQWNRVWHEGNLRGDGDNDNRYVRLSTNQTISGEKYFTDNVGIGTTSPNEKLTVYGNSSPSIELKNGSNYSAGGFVINRTNYGQKWKWWAQSQSMYFAYATSGGYSNKLTLNGSTGNLGVGTSPNDKLEVNGNIRANRFTDRNNTAYYVDPASTSQLNRIDINSQIRHRGDTDTYMQFHDSDQWRVVTGGTERLEVNNSKTTVKNALIADGNVYVQDLSSIYSNWGLDSSEGNFQSASPLSGKGFIQTAWVYANAIESNNKGPGTTGLYIGDYTGTNPEDNSLALRTNGDNRLMVIGNGDVGIGTPSPSEKLEVNGNIRVDIGSNGTGGLFIYGSNQSTGRVYVGQDSNYGGGIEYNGDGSPATTGAGSDYITLWRRSGGNDEWTARNQQSNNKWEFRGDVIAYASDERLKENIKILTDPIKKIKTLKGVEYDWIEKCEELGFIPNKKHETGVLAQNVKKAIPDAIYPAPFDKEYLTVDKQKIIPLLIEGIKEQQTTIDKLENKNKEQQQQINSLNKRLEKLEKLLS